MKRVFLTGATSYLGSQFIQLYGSKYSIFWVSRQNGCDLLDFQKVSQWFHEFKPDFIVHTAASIGRDSQADGDIIHTNPAITEHLISLAKIFDIPFIFTSTEAVYWWKEQEGNYSENDTLKPRNEYGQSKILSENIIQDSWLPYLITRWHRYVWLNGDYHRPKQFLDFFVSALRWDILHLDSKKVFTPVHIDHLCSIIDFYIENKSKERILINVWTETSTTFYQFMKDVLEACWKETSFLFSDWEEKGWPHNSSLDISLLLKSDFPKMTYREMITRIKDSYLKV